MMNHAFHLPEAPLVASLIEAGDHACRARDGASLAAVASVLDGRLGAALDARVRSVATRARVDLDGAVATWNAIARAVRDWNAASFVHRN